MRPVPLPPSRWNFDPAGWPDDDCVAGGADLAPETIVDAYRHGAFPMPHGRQVLWWSPLERGVLGPGELRVSRSLRRSLARFTITVDTDFAGVVKGCADPSRPGGWITRPIRAAYQRLFDLGHAHSIETRDEDGRLVGGLYGLGIGALFAGESMFHRRTDASKAALVGLVDVMSTLATAAERVDGAPPDGAPQWLIDTQWRTPHLASLGVRTMPRPAYLDAIGALVDAPPPHWPSPE